MSRLRRTSNRLRDTLRRIVRARGFDIVRFDSVGVDPFADMKHFLETEAPVVFDVGANVGQSVDQFRKTFARPTLHSFEPSPSTFGQLRGHCSGMVGVNTWNMGVGASNRRMALQENSQSVMSSFLAPSAFAWGEVVRATEVPVVALDAFCDDHGIERIDVLKSDTQGFELEVFKGAAGLMKAGRIRLVYFEMIFSDMYKNLPGFDEVFRFLLDHGFVLVSFYRSTYQQDLASWTDALFIHRDHYRDFMARS